MQNDEPAGEDRVYQQIEAADLNQEGRMTDEGYSDFVVCYENWLVLFAFHRVECRASDQSKNETEVWAFCHEISCIRKMPENC